MNDPLRDARRSIWPALIVGILVSNAPLAYAGITPVNTDFLNDTVDRTSYTKSFDASGGSNPVGKLIVSVGTESNPPTTAVNSAAASNGYKPRRMTARARWLTPPASTTADGARQSTWSSGRRGLVTVRL